jgi:hypothetical protein
MCNSEARGEGREGGKEGLPTVKALFVEERRTRE